MFRFLLLPLVLAATGASAVCEWPTTGAGAPDPVLTELCLAVNEQRSLNGAPPLVLDAGMIRAAQLHAGDMVARDYFSHTNPEGLNVWDRLRLQGVVFVRSGENIAWGQRDVPAVMASWMGSAGHRANMLNPLYRRLGLGFAERRWVQTFAD